MMREIFDNIFSQPPLDPVKAARSAMRPRLRRRFYKEVQLAEAEGGFALAFDGRPVKTPARRVLAAPERVLAEGLAGEWRAQTEAIDPATMPLTRLANSIIDGVAPAPDVVTEEIARYFAADLIVYRAEGPQELVARQAQAWDPLVDWMRATLDAEFVPVQGIKFVAQPAPALAAARAALPRDPWRLGALSAMTTLTGSAVIALAVLRGRL